MQRFIRRNCGAAYAVKVQPEPADREPFCEECDFPLPDETESGWLHYEHQPELSPGVWGALELAAAVRICLSTICLAHGLNSDIGDAFFLHARAQDC